LSQFTADAPNRQVIAGAVEATVAGDILMQMIALGQVPTLSQAGQVVRHAFALSQSEPGDRAGWDQGYACLLAVMQPTG
jgi:rhamnulokinase